MQIRVGRRSSRRGHGDVSDLLSGRWLGRFGRGHGADDVQLAIGLVQIDDFRAQRQPGRSRHVENWSIVGGAIAA